MTYMFQRFKLYLLCLFSVIFFKIFFSAPNAELSCPGNLRYGDIYTHTFHAYDSTILDVTTRNILSDVIEARSRGVLFDVGHGAGGFSWLVAETAAKQSFFPDMLGEIMYIFIKLS